MASCLQEAGQCQWEGHSWAERREAPSLRSKCWVAVLMVEDCTRALEQGQGEVQDFVFGFGYPSMTVA